MFNLVAAVLSIALFASLLAATVSYVPADRDIRIAMTSQMHTQLAAMQTAAVCYAQATAGAYPAVASWQSALSPIYVFLPTPPSGMSLTYGSGAYSSTVTDDWFCLSNPTTPAEQAALNETAQQFSAQQAVLSSACGTAPPGASSGTTLTLWLPVSPTKVTCP
jgi:hypothetical protein